MRNAIASALSRLLVYYYCKFLIYNWSNLINSYRKNARMRILHAIIDCVISVYVLLWSMQYYYITCAIHATYVRHTYSAVSAICTISQEAYLLVCYAQR